MFQQKVNHHWGAQPAGLPLDKFCRALVDIADVPEVLGHVLADNLAAAAGAGLGSRLGLVWLADRAAFTDPSPPY